MHYPPHYPGAYYGRFRRGPSRLLWFFLGGAAVAWWYNKHDGYGKENKFMSWCRERRQLKNQPQDQTRYENQNQTQGYNAYSSNRENQPEPEPLWKLRGEKEAEQRQLAEQAQFREDMNRAREKMLSVTESGLNSLRESLDSLTKMVHEQRRDRPSGTAPPVNEHEKRD